MRTAPPTEPPTRPPRAAQRARGRTASVAATALASTIALAGAIGLGGCASSAGIAPAAQALAPAAIGLDADAAPAPAIGAAWWLDFDDATLTALIERALDGHPSLKLAHARLTRAAAAVAGAQAAEGPQVAGALDATRQRFSATSIYPPPLGGSTRTLATAQIGASWEIDFFGRHRAAIEAAVGAERAAWADLQAARQMLASQVARSYVQLGRLQAQRAVMADALRLRADTLALIRQRVTAGLDTQVELRQGEGALPDARQQIEQLDEQITLVRHALAALTVQPPAALAALDAPLRRLQVLPLPAALPADLLGRRADVSAARWRAEAAASAVQGAKAAFYPNVNLAAFVGLSSIGLDRLVDIDSRQLGAGPAVRLPIFDAGRLRAELRGRTADLDAAVESYNTAVVDAVHDAADQIGSLRAVGRQQAEQTLAQAAAESAYDLALQRYHAGLTPYLTVLNVEAAVINQRRLAVDLKARALDTQIALIRALGGGFSDDTPPAAQRAQLDRTAR